MQDKSGQGRAGQQARKETERVVWQAEKARPELHGQIDEDDVDEGTVATGKDREWQSRCDHMCLLLFALLQISVPPRCSCPRAYAPTCGAHSRRGTSKRQATALPYPACLALPYSVDPMRYLVCLDHPLPYALWLSSTDHRAPGG